MVLGIHGCSHLLGTKGTAGGSVVQGRSPTGPRRCWGIVPAAAKGSLVSRAPTRCFCNQDITLETRLKRTKPVLSFQPANSRPCFHNLHSSYEDSEIRGHGSQSWEHHGWGRPQLHHPCSPSSSCRHAPVRSKAVPVPAFKRLRAALCVSLMPSGHS